MSDTRLTLTPDELVSLTGRRRARDQLAELHRCGFVRARMSPAGTVVLERAHYDAVCRMATGQAERPKVRPAVRRVA